MSSRSVNLLALSSKRLTSTCAQDDWSCDRSPLELTPVVFTENYGTALELTAEPASLPLKQ